MIAVLLLRLALCADRLASPENAHRLYHLPALLLTSLWPSKPLGQTCLFTSGTCNEPASLSLCLQALAVKTLELETEYIFAALEDETLDIGEASHVLGRPSPMRLECSLHLSACLDVVLPAWLSLPPPGLRLSLTWRGCCCPQCLLAD